jgi:hypothetical protein
MRAVIPGWAAPEFAAREKLSELAEGVADLTESAGAY